MTSDAMTTRVAVMGRGEVRADSPVVRADDLGFAHGDGCFETLRVLGRPNAEPLLERWEEHLDRFEASCATMDLPAPDRSAWALLVKDLTARFPDGAEAALRLVVTRGLPGEGLTNVAVLTPAGAGLFRARAQGVRAVSLPLGVDSHVRAQAPWLLGGVKCLSYAVNFAALREAARRGADEVVFVDVHGRVLEGPTASVLWSVDGELRTPPVAGTGVLPGTVQRAVFEAAHAQGLVAREVDGTVADLLCADGVWFTSSIRGVVEVTALDGTAVNRDAVQTARLRAWAGF